MYMGETFKSLQGKFILDSGKLAGSFFEKSVILICRHNDSGAFGLILNRPVKKVLGSALEGSLPKELLSIPLYLGGPVQPEALSFLYETEEKHEYDILPRVSVSHSLQEVHEQLSAKSSINAHAFAGYSGWSSGQLENELKTGSWIVHASSFNFIFKTKPEEIWKSILKVKGGIHRLQAEFPEDPSLN
jgi:putative transcriptional regulator